jgi:hypothetical protein
MEMDIQTLKLELVEKIIQAKNQSLLLKVNKLLESEKGADWWDEIPAEVRDSILEGMEDVKEGRIFSHQQVLQEARAKYGF